MLVVALDKANFEYDVHSLVKAFYPGEQVIVLTPETKPEKQEELQKEIRIAIELAKEGAKVVIEGQEYHWQAQKSADDNSINKGNYRDSEKNYKDGFKRFLYQILSEVTKQALPWGNLTGIRPTKIAYGM